jgi:branched-chain amino acid transport system ATP-binding protein
MESTLADYHVGGVLRTRSGSVLPGVAPSNVYPTADGAEVVIAANADSVFGRLAEAMGDPELATDQKYATHQARGAAMAELDALVAAWTKSHDSGELITLLQRHGVPVGMINTAATILTDEHFARGERHRAADERRRPQVLPHPRRDRADRARARRGHRRRAHRTRQRRRGRTRRTARGRCAVTDLLTLDGVTVRFGGVAALDHVSFSVRAGQIAALIGPNGAGKTTAFNAISRLVPLAEGGIHFDGRDLQRLDAAALSGMGIARSFQNLALWPGMTVLENVMVGRHARGRVGFVSALFGAPARREDREVRARAYAMLDYFDIADVAHRECTGLPFGTLKRVELARALIAEPRLLLLDEPAGGLAHGDVRELGELLLRLREEHDMTLLLVEHHMQFVMGISDYVIALDFGRNLVSGTPAELRDSPELVEAYLGTPV